MESLNKQQMGCYFQTVVERMINPLIERIKNGDMCEEKVTEVLKSVSILLKFITSFDEVQSLSQSEDQFAVLESLFRDVCFPLIYSLHYLSPSEKGRAVSLLTHLICACCQRVQDKELPYVVTQIIIPFYSCCCVSDSLLSVLKNGAYHDSMVEPLDRLSCLELFAGLLTNQNFFDRYLTCLEKVGIDKHAVLEELFHLVFGCAADESAFCKSFTVITKLLTHCPSFLRSKCEAKVWEAFTAPRGTHHGSTDHKFVWQSLYVCYTLKNSFFPLDEAEKEALAAKVSNNNFWALVQSGLASPDASHRKLAMYLLKRLVDTCNKYSCTVNSVVYDQHSKLTSLESLPLFWWSPTSADKLSVIWEDFILLIETLEEKQVHIIKPLLSRMQKLIDASMISSNGPPMLHSSWLITIVTRCFQHDSHYMSRWGAQNLLSLDFEKVPLIQHGQLKFLSHDLLTFLQENKLYARYDGTELGKSSPVGEALKGFFASLFSTLTKEQKVEYLGNLLRIVCENNWGSIPLTFVFEGLSHIAPGPVIGAELLRLIRQILQSCLATHEVYTRGAIECFICQTVINLMDLESVSLNEFFSTLAALNREESLQRGTTLWSSVVSWLGTEDVCKKWTDRDVLVQALGYLQDNLNSEDNSVIVDGYKVISIARMLILFSDMKEQKLSRQASQEPELKVLSALENSPLGLVLAEISDTLTDIRSRSYVNINKVDKCLSLIFSLSKEIEKVNHSWVDMLMQTNLAMHFKDVSFFVRTRLSESLNKAADIDMVKFYMDVLLSLGQLNGGGCLAELRELVLFVNRAFTLAMDDKSGGEKLVEYDVLSTSAMKLLSTVFKILSSNTLENGFMRKADIVRRVCEMVPVLDVPLPFSRKNSSKEVSKAHIGRVVSRFISSKWKCQKQLFEQWLAGKGDSSQHIEGLRMDWKRIFAEAMEDLSVGSGSSDVAIFQAVEVIMGELITKIDPASILKLIDLGWRKVMEEKKNIRFWKKLKMLIPLGLHPALLLQGKDTAVGCATDEFVTKLISLAVDKTGVLYIVLDHLGTRILQNDPDRKMATRLIPLLVEACYIGTIYKRGERLWLDVCSYIESLGDSCSVNQTTSCFAKNDLYTRVMALNWLLHLRCDVPTDQEFVSAFLQALTSKYLAVAIQTSNKQFANSLAHRQKHRMVLVLLLLVDFIKMKEHGEYLALLWHALEVESHPSVRQMLEWLVMILIIHNPQSASSIWEVFRLFDNKRSVCLCSIFLIISHVGITFPPELQEKYYTQALTSVMPWTMAHHYNTRMFAQATLTRLWQQCQQLQLNSVITQHAMVQPVLDFLFSNCNASATVLKLLNYYMYSPFDPAKDYSIETICHTLPRLACLADDEWILPKHFIQTDNTWEQPGKHLIRLWNDSDQLALCKEGPWRMKFSGDFEDDTAASESVGKDVQKKIMPWRQMSPSDETEAELVSQRLRRPEDGLILVTTLIDKVPNLGGLCRTSEIFGVSEFVIGSLAYVEDKMFQNLSVSAQKWIKITEVLQPRLPEFLEEKRMQGYTLVGVEQTANSISLQDYQFPRKTLLLLGNEKEGIPVELIQLLDVCVEIPQLGVIRSLNVHVCGALIIWEYTRQHMKDTCAAGSSTATITS